MIVWADFPSGQTGLYGTTASYMSDGIYADVTGAEIAEDPDPGVTGNTLRIQQGDRWRYVLPSNQATVGVALKNWTAGFGSENSDLMAFYNASATAHVRVRVTVNGYITIETAAGVVATTDGPVITTNAWYQIEAKVVIDNAVGTVEVRVNNVNVVDFTGDTQNSDATVYSVGANRDTTSQSNGYNKDIVIWDGTGSSGNDFQGFVAAYLIVPDADITDGGWTLSTGSDIYALLDETPPDDADYVSADDSPPAPFEINFTSLPVDAVSVRTLIPIVRAKKTDSGVASLQVSLSPDGVDYEEGDDRPMTTAFTYWYDQMPTDPATSAAWIPGAVNTVRARVDRTV